MQRLSQWFKKIIAIPWLPAALTAAGALVYVLTAINTARTKTSFLDEGLYLVKGLLFATGKYIPFQDYGPWTNHMPFIFLIHGYIQKWFGPGLPTARYFMIALGVLTLIAMYLLARRWGGRWWAVAVIWAMALNPAEIKFHTLAISEGVIAPMMAWMFVLLLGAHRKNWQVILGGVLAGVMGMTRMNMFFVLPLVTLYIFWERGWKMALYTALAGGLVVIAGHLLYWPDILKLWAKWLPFASILDPWRVPASAFGIPIPPSDNPTPYLVFLYTWMTFRLHFVALVSCFAAVLLWPNRKGKRMTMRVRAAAFLAFFVVFMLLAHMAASFLGSWCVSCILLYSAYFDYLGLIVLAMSFRFLQRDLPNWRQWLIYAGIALLIIGVGFTTYEDVSSDFAKVFIEKYKDSYLWNFLTNLTHFSALYLFRALFTIGVSLLVIAALAAAVWAARRSVRGKQMLVRRGAYYTLIFVLIAGFVLSPTKVLGKGNDFFNCDGSNVFESYAEVGEYLRSVIPPGSQVYWDGRIDALLLYLPGIEIYPPQLNQSHSFYYGGDSDLLLKNGYWTEELAKQWMKEADFILLEKGEKLDFEVKMVEGGGFESLGQTRKVEKCRWQSIIEIYRPVK
jgi:4-amino-4-deoxy-L-arabinose transferase-like glycosyltransferase